MRPKAHTPSIRVHAFAGVFVPTVLGSNQKPQGQCQGKPSSQVVVVRKRGSLSPDTTQDRDNGIIARTGKGRAWAI